MGSARVKFGVPYNREVVLQPKNYASNATDIVARFLSSVRGLPRYIIIANS